MTKAHQVFRIPHTRVSDVFGTQRRIVIAIVIVLVATAAGMIASISLPY
jgi:hypothetical protein